MRIYITFRTLPAEVFGIDPLRLEQRTPEVNESDATRIHLLKGIREIKAPIPGDKRLWPSGSEHQYGVRPIFHMLGSHDSRS